jgi:hypothetical protein
MEKMKNKKGSFQGIKTPLAKEQVMRRVPRKPDDEEEERVTRRKRRR